MNRRALETLFSYGKGVSKSKKTKVKGRERKPDRREGNPSWT